MTLELSYDRKVAPGNRRGTWNGRGVWRAVVPNSFGLPSGVSCPGKTSFCRSCYGANLEHAYSAAGALVRRNWDQLKNARFGEMVALIGEMMDRFERAWPEAVQKVFRIHWDGDFFSQDYLDAWIEVMTSRPDTLFWAYTRSFELIDADCEIENFTLYLSIDADNIDQARKFRAWYPWLKGAYCASHYRSAMTLAEAEPIRCPENARTKPLVGDDGQGACLSCRLCITGKADIMFASSKREDINVSVHRRQRQLF